MNDEKMITLSLDEPQTQSSADPYEVFTCEKCGFGTCERIGRCPHCGRRMLNADELKGRNSNLKGGIWFIIFGLLSLIFHLVYVLSNNAGLKELFAKVSPNESMSISKFTFMFSIPAVLLSIGFAVLILKKDSLTIRLLIGIPALAIFFAADYLIPKLLY